jgi:uncharacterized membrane protein YfhO
MQVLLRSQIDRSDQVDVVDLVGPFTTDVEWEMEPTSKGLAFLPLYQDGGWRGRVSVADEDGWKALDLWKADGVGMAMEVPKGAVRLVLSYQTPGLDLGVLVSCLGAACLLATSLNARKLRL